MGVRPVAIPSTLMRVVVLMLKAKLGLDAAEWQCNRQRNVMRVTSCSPWANPARAEGMRVAGSIWFVPIAA
jgi:hypothetical protein